MKKIIIPISIIFLTSSLIISCGGKKEDATETVESTVNEEVATRSETSEMDSSENEKSTTEKIEVKAKEVKDKVVEKVIEGKEASRPLLNKVKGQIKEKLERKEVN
jgi:hypothetical protein